jgi:hypothetical protein
VKSPNSEHTINQYATNMMDSYDERGSDSENFGARITEIELRLQRYDEKKL